MRRLKELILRTVPGWVLTGLRSTRWHWRACRQTAFDRTYGVDTTGVIEANRLDVVEDKRRLANRYEASPRSTFVRAVRSLGLDYSRYTFIDIGSGKGAVLLYASRFPFKRIVGLELSERLSRIAESNIAAYRSRRTKCHDITSQCTDALAYQLPRDPLVLYLFNPFNEETTAALLSNAERSLRDLPRPFFIVSFNPSVEPALNRAVWLARVKTGWNFAAYRSRL